ncbi:unnamed protein product [Rotaria sp. Silwood2]|nr:unnamed protein product [Rotaria sp. Silwood2]CAF4497242.1 unnamed protein product [Rotaria sp. Silwood2]
MEQLPKEPIEKSSSDTSILPMNTDPKQSSCTSSIPTIMLSIDLLLLIFIRYLQLVKFIPWSSPMSICDGSIEIAKHNEIDSSSQITFKSRKFKNTHKNLSIEPGLCSLTNIGNTCFMNSAIQCLSNIPKLTEWAKKQNLSNHEKTVTQAYTSLIKSMWSGKNSYVAPHDIKKRISQHARIFSDYAQKDSHEFMNSLLNVLHSEFIENDSSKEQSSIISNLFSITTQSKVTCLDCDICDSLEEITYCLPLPLENESTVTLQTLLDDFLKEEQLDGQYYCSNCQDLRSAKQQTSLCQPLPPVIIVQLKRFTFNETNDKLNTLVNYPIINWNVDGNGDSLYDLVAVSMHVGNLKGGHYTTFARLNGSDEWYHFNDSNIEPVLDSRRLVNRNAYVLVYLKKN